MAATLWLASSALGGLGGESPAGEACALRFEERAEQAGVAFHHFASRRAALLPEDNGSGLAFGDYDNDGHDDLYVVNLAGPVLMPREELVRTRPGGKLFHNEGDGTFREVTQASGLIHVGWDMAAVWGDVNGDGWLDLVLTGIDEVALFLNRGDGAFQEASRQAGLGALDCFASGAALADYDRDGDLDLYVPCYVAFPWERARHRPLVGGRPATMTTPADYPPQRNYLFENDGTGRFRDVATAAGVLDETGRGLQSLFTDLNGDGWPDLYVANDQSFDRLYRNRGDRTFEDASPTAGTRDPRAGMGIGVGDFDSDGALDVFLTHWVGEQNALYRNLSTEEFLLFEDVTLKEGLAPVDSSWVGWGTGFYDLELDGDLDLFLVNGSTIEDEWTLEVLSDPKMIPQPLRVYEKREERFEDASGCAGEIFEALLVGRGAAFSDYDRDGRVDVAVSVHNGSALLLRNSSPRRGNWLAVELVGAAPNRWAVGAKVIVRTADASWVRRLIAGESYLGSNTARLHFGLGRAVEAEAIEVHWPSGAVSLTGPVPVNGTIRLRESVEGWEDGLSGRQAPRARGESGDEIRD
ncbi:MAG: CRTAC1 family protein [Thermoanaerobaculia bacterium]